MNIKEFGKTLLKQTNEHLPAIFTGFAIATSALALGKAIYDTPKAIKLLDAYENEVDREATPVEKIQVCWKVYLPSLILEGCAITFMVCSHRTSAKRLAALAALYSISEDRVKALKTKIEEKITPTKARLVEEEATAALSERTPLEPEKIIATGKGSTLVYDSASGRYFYSDRESIRQAENDLNAQIISEGYACLNELYYSIGLTGVKIGDIIGWDTGEMLRISFGSKLTEDGTPCMVIDYTCKPAFI